MREFVALPLDVTMGSAWHRSKAFELKRHPALEPLSRDHHHALVVAQRLKRADEATAREARDIFLEYWNHDGRHHFREEEDILLPACAGFMDTEQPLVAKVLTDHIQIRHLADQLEAQHPPLTILHALGRRLEQHIRREERELFPLIEQAMPDAELRRLVSLLTASPSTPAETPGGPESFRPPGRQGSGGAIP